MQDKRERLISPMAVTILGVLIIFAGWLIFLQQGLVKRMHADESNAVSIAYMEAWLRSKPEDLDFAAQLAKEYVNVGRYTRAENLLASLDKSNNPGIRQRSMLIRIQMLEQQEYELASDDPDRKGFQTRIIQILQTAVPMQWNVADTESLAVSSANAADYGDALTLYRRLAVMEPERADYWLAKAALLTSKNIDYAQIAADYFARERTVTDLASQRTYFISGLKELQAGDLLSLIMPAAQTHITPQLLQDTVTLRFLVRLAQACDRADLAADYAKRLLASYRNNPPGRDDLTNAVQIKPQASAADSMQWMPGIVQWRIAHNGASAASTKLRSAGVTVARAEYQRPVQRTPISPITYPDEKKAAAPVTATAPIAAPTPTEAAVSTATDIAKATPEDDLELTYNAFLGNHDLMAALNVTNRALTRSPNSAMWLERRAQVLEWSGQPALALPEWVKAARTTNSDRAWAAVLRLAPGLNDDISYLAALQHQGVRNPSDKLMADTLAVYERIGDANGAQVYLQKQLGKSRPEKILRMAADLADRMGQDDIALADYLELNRRFGPKEEYAIKLANFYLARSDFKSAADVLAQVKGRVKDQDADYWRLTFHTAELAQNSVLQKEAALHLLSGSKPEASDMDAMIALWDSSPIDAGRLSELAYQRTGRVMYLQQAIYQYSRAKAWNRVRLLMGSLTQQQQAAAEKQPEYLLVKAEFQLQTGTPDEALDTMRQAVKINATYPGVRFAYLWLVIDRSDNAELRTALMRWSDDAEKDPGLWGPYAAGWLRLQNASQSLHYFKLQAPEQQQDPLWALAYADALQEFGQVTVADGIRQTVWKKMREKREGMYALAGQRKGAINAISNDGLDDETRADLRSRSITLAQVFEGNDQSKQMLTELLRADYQYAPAQAQNSDKIALPEKISSDRETVALDQADPKTRGQRVRADAVAQDVALAWALSAEPYTLAKEWLAQRYAANGERPAYAQAEIALQSNDQQALAKLLADHPDRLPYLNRIDANIRLDRNDEARRLASEGLAANPDSNELHDRLVQTELYNPNQLEVGGRFFRQSPLRFTDETAELRLRLAEHWNLRIHALTRQQQSDDAVNLRNIPSTDRSFGVGLGYVTSQSNLLFDVSHRIGVEAFNAALFEGNWGLLNHISYGATVGINQEATESAQLRVGGVKDYGALNAEWRLGEHEFLQARVEGARYFAQDRTYLGRGNQVELDAGYRFRVEYPDYTIRAVVSHANYSQSGDGGPVFARILTPDNNQIMPLTDTEYGLIFEFGQDIDRGYSHRWRPAFQFGYLHSMQDGWGYTARVGTAGTVFGNDHLFIYYGHDRNLRNGSTPASEGGMSYRWYF